MPGDVGERVSAVEATLKSLVDAFNRLADQVGGRMDRLGNETQECRADLRVQRRDIEDLGGRMRAVEKTAGQVPAIAARVEKLESDEERAIEASGQERTIQERRREGYLLRAATIFTAAVGWFLFLADMLMRFVGGRH